ncbi:hypothetical protein Pcinc_000601 [Petrolisthes cinctipes]|uniref:Uncharacterized protein n=1 Tax=Petrolisthes cinctipes TaxID=88211 RepID=A0AAE1GLS8_PETCI|nr:hypothetical protein Pcinc_000601 [Petrolisthes cinctipes]
MIKIRDAILFYAVFNLDESNTDLILFIFYNLAYFFTFNRSSSSDDDGDLRTECGEDIEFITVRDCSTRCLAVNFNKSIKKIKKKYNTDCSLDDEEDIVADTLYTTGSPLGDLKWAIDNYDSHAVRYLSTCLFEEEDEKYLPRLEVPLNIPFRVEEESFPSVINTLENLNVFFNSFSNKAYNNSREVWNHLSAIADVYDKRMQGCMGRSISDEMEVAIETLRLYFQGTFFTSNTASKVAILLFAALFVCHATKRRDDIILDCGDRDDSTETLLQNSIDTAERNDPVFASNKKAIGQLLMTKQDLLFDYEKDHLYFSTSDRYGSAAPYSFNREYTPSSGNSTYVHFEEYPGLVEKMTGRDERQLRYHHDNTTERPCSPATAFCNFAFNTGGSNYSENVAYAIQDTPGARLPKERYAFSNNEGILKRFRATKLSDKFGVDGLFVHLVKNKLGVSSLFGRCRHNLFQKKDIASAARPSQSTPLAVVLESSAPGHNGIIRTSDNPAAKSNFKLFAKFFGTNPAQKMRFMSLIVLRAVLSVGKKLTIHDVCLYWDDPEDIEGCDYYITIENEEGVGEKMCGEVFEDCKTFIDMCTPLARKDLELLPPWCADLFSNSDVTLHSILYKPEYVTPSSSGSQAKRNLFKTKRVRDDIKRAFRFFDMASNLHKMSIEDALMLSSDEFSGRTNVEALKSSRKAEIDRYVDANNTRIRTVYGTTVQSPDLYDSSEHDSRPMANPFLPKGERAFMRKRAPPLGDTSASSSVVGVHPYDKYR